MDPLSLNRASSAASADPVPFPTPSTTHAHALNHHSRSQSTGNTPNAAMYQSNFKHCLKSIPIPNELADGIAVMRVHANGTTQKQYLTLSQDKFTLYITNQPLKHGAVPTIHKRRSWLGLLQRKTSHNGENAYRPVANHPPHHHYYNNQHQNNNHHPNTSTNIGTAAAASYYHKANANAEVRAIDIGAIHRIQRGHANRIFEEMLK
jgi:hypothetical protein